MKYLLYRHRNLRYLRMLWWLRKQERRFETSVWW